MPRCDHIVFRVSDIERSVAFYERVLPARVIARKEGNDRWRSRLAWLEPEGQPGFAVVLVQPTRVRLLLRILHALTPRIARSFEHFGLACASRDEVVARFAAAIEAGARPMNPPALIDAKTGFIAEVRDPDGNPIEWTHGQTFG